MAAPDASPIVEATDLEKSFGSFEAVKGISFRIEKGQCFGFLGPNGAGKTSTMRMVQAVSDPSGGALRVFGLDPIGDGKAIRARLGVTAQEDNLDPELPVLDNLVIYARYFRIPKKVARERAESLLEFVSLVDKRKNQIRELSGGMRRRLMIARSLVNDPELVILDEPTTGLDPQARHLVWKKLRELRERGVTMILTTHYMDEAERLCDELVIMDDGKILARGAPSTLIDEHAGAEVVELRAPAEREEAVLTNLDLNGAVTERVGDVRYFFLERRSEVADRVIEAARTVGIPCLLRNGTLEDVFLRLTGRELEE